MDTLNSEIMTKWLPRFNRLVTNRIQGVWAWLLPPWAVIVHRGRKSGKVYRTPVLALRDGDTIVIALLYGDRSDWVRNLLTARRGGIERAGRLHSISAPRIIDLAVSGSAPPPPQDAVGNDGNGSRLRQRPDDTQALPSVARIAARHVKVLVAKIDDWDYAPS